MKSDITSHVYQALRGVGLEKRHIHALLPEWWEPSIAKTESGQWEFALLVARRLSLDVAALAAGQLLPTGAFSDPKFKHTARFDAGSLRAATMIASSLAQAVLAALPDSGVRADDRPETIRDQLLTLGGGDPGFDALLDYSWRKGIPVIAIPELPPGVRKMDAAALAVNGRPAIIIAKKSDSKSWLAFLLAHELAHIVYGHVPRNGVIVEGSLSDTIEFDVQQENDVQEREATLFALTVLGGLDARRTLGTWSRDLMPVSLAARAVAEAKKLSASPGNLILQYGHLHGRWADAQQALRFLDNETGALNALSERLAREIAPESIAEDLQDYLAQITGVGVRAA